MNYRPDIDGLRTLAVLPVVFFHANITGFSGGFVGVDIFFVISGYLITTIIWREISDDSFSISKFYERRARRILPALLAVIFFSAIVGYVIFTPEEMSAFAQSILGSLFFFQNILLGAQAGYFDAASETKPLLHIWSLAVEEQFYILFPLVLLVASRWMSRDRIVFFLGLVFLTSFAISAYLVYTRPVFTFYMLPTRAWELLAGSLLALVANNRSLVKKSKWRDAASILGLAAVIVPIFTYSGDTLFPGLAALPPVVGAAAIIWAGSESFGGRMLSWKPIVFIGLISYSLYLWHWPLMAFHTLIFPGEISHLHGFLLILVSFALAVLSWRFIEKPFRSKDGLLNSRGSVFVWSGLAMTITAGLALAIVLGSGWAWRASPDIIALAKVTEEKELSDQRCRPEVVLFTLRGRDRGFCKLGSEEEGAPELVIWGDSHVGAWYPLLDEALRNSGPRALAITMAGCPIAFNLARADIGKDGCLESGSAVRAYIESNDVPKVLIVASWFGVLDEKNTVYQGTSSHDAESRLQNAVSAISDTGNAFSDMGVKSGFLLTVPGAKHSVPEAMFRKARLGAYPEIRRTAESYQSIMAPLQGVAQAHYDAVLRSDDLICTDGFCDVLRDGKPLYYDTNHPTQYLNTIMLPHLQTQLDNFLFN